MIDFERMLEQGERIEKVFRFLIIFIVVAIVFAWIGQEIVAVYFVNNPEALSSWLGELIYGFNQ